MTVSRTGLLVRAALVLPLAGGALLAAAGPAAADISAPGDGVTYTNREVNVAISASVPQSTTQSRLVLKAPDGGSRELDAAGNRDTFNRYPAQTLSGNLDTDCATADCSAGQVKPAMNGTWTVQLSGASSDSQTFVLRIPPKAPTAVSAETTAFREVTVSWTRGAEPDLTGFTLLDGGGSVVSDGIGTGACNGTRCTTVVRYGEDDSGERVFTVRAHRSTAPDSGDRITSDDSGSASATLQPKAAPQPEPTTDPGTGGTTGDPGTTGGSTTGGSTTGGSTTGGSTTGGSTTGGSTTGGSTTGGSTTGGPAASPGASGKPAITTGTTSDTRAIEQRRAFALTFRAFAPKLGIPKLPPLPQVQKPVAAPEGELEDGTFEETLGYGDQEVQEKVEILGSQRLGGAVNGALDSAQFMRFLAAALVMLLTAAHLRRWLGATATTE